MECLYAGSASLARRSRRRRSKVAVGRGATLWKRVKIPMCRQGLSGKETVVKEGISTFFMNVPLTSCNSHC